MVFANILGILLVVLIVWWFWLYEPKRQAIANEQVILVKNGVYEPAHIEVTQHGETQLKFLREDQSPCAATVVFPTLDISEELKLGQETIVALPALSKGVYPFGCQMQMYRGELFVKS